MAVQLAKPEGSLGDAELLEAVELWEVGWYRKTAVTLTVTEWLYLCLHGWLGCLKSPFREGGLGEVAVRCNCSFN